MKTIISILALAWFCSCATATKQIQEIKKMLVLADLGTPTTDADFLELQPLMDMNEKGKSSNETLKAFREFQQIPTPYEQNQTKRPQSLYLQTARFGEAWALEILDFPSESLELYHSVMQVSQGRLPQLYARSLYRSHFNYEKLGQEAQVIAVLKEAQSLSQDLPREIALVEIPSKLSMIYAKMNQPADSEIYLKQTEQGLRQLLTQEKPSNEWLARVYVQMGTVNMSQTHPENLESYLNGQKAVQRYLLQALNFNDPIWSDRAAKNIVQNYNSFWTQIQSYDKIQATDSYDQVAIVREQFQLTTLFSKMLNEALMLKPLDEQRMNPFQSKIFVFLETLDKKSYDYMYSKFDQMFLTPESLELNSIKRPGKVEPKELFPSEKGN